MTWTFKQSTGELFDADMVLSSVGYAGGNCGKNIEGKNNPSMQSVQCVGPLPQGVYTLSLPVEGTHLGPFAIPLIPDANNEMFGRGRFYIHGDTTPSGNASEGCVIMPRAIRGAMAASGDTLTVVE
jgi:hypothetical protein